MAFLFLFFTVALSLCVVGLIIIALAAILGTVRDDWKLKKPKKTNESCLRETGDFGNRCRFPALLGRETKALALGPLRGICGPFREIQTLSALPSKADIVHHRGNVRFLIGRLGSSALRLSAITRRAREIG